jgi:hypothetical protein
LVDDFIPSFVLPIHVCARRLFVWSSGSSGAVSEKGRGDFNLTFAEDEPERIGSRPQGLPSNVVTGGEGEEMERAEARTGIDAAGQVAGGP